TGLRSHLPVCGAGHDFCRLRTDCARQHSADPKPRLHGSRAAAPETQPVVDRRWKSSESQVDRRRKMNNITHADPRIGGRNFGDFFVQRDAMVLLLTWAAGGVDAISYLGLGHVFTANMTGNAVQIGRASCRERVMMWGGPVM